MSTKIGDKTLYSVKEVSQKLNVTPVTIWKYLKEGKLRGQKAMGRWFILDKDLMEFFKEL